VGSRKRSDSRQKEIERALRGLQPEDFPGFIEPHLAKQSSGAPAGSNWIHELKLDGYRIQAHLKPKENGLSSEARVRLFTRNGLDWTNRIPDLAHSVSALPIESCILDGEMVALDNEGRSNFSDLQAAFQQRKLANLVYFAFDILHLDGHNLRNLHSSNAK
jgi:bifunctional non-homologous end joining protein LigD